MNKMSRTLSPLLLASLALAACGSQDAGVADPSTAPAATPPLTATPPGGHDGHDHDHDGHDHAAEAQEVTAPQPRLVMTHADGLMVVDATTLKVIDTIAKPAPADGLLRLRESGDSRYVLVDSSTKLEVLDLGAWTEAHGDHGHSFTSKPHLTGVALSTQKAGHVSPNGGTTAVFDDGDGSVEVYQTEALGQDNPTPVRTLNLPPHHGNAIPLEGDRLLHTVVEGDKPTGVEIVDKSGTSLAKSTKCPGTHGSAVASGGAVVIGCQDGYLLIKADQITKVKGDTEFARSGNLFGSPESPRVLGDLKRSKDAKPTEVVVIDTVAGTHQVVTLGAPYTFRGLAHASDGHALVLTNDGKLNIIHGGSVENSIQVTEPFTEPEDWMEPRPTLYTQGHLAYITDPAAKKVHAVDLKQGKVTMSGDLPHAPNEVTGTLG